jgi:hypothetical protein
MKLCKDANVIDTHLTRTNIDLIFTKIKTKGSTRISYDQFIHCIHMFAEKKRCKPNAIMEQIACLRGPSVSGTIADGNRFHDDKSTYTGVYARGGPTKIDGAITQGNLLDRNQAGVDVRGVRTDAYDNQQHSRREATREVRHGNVASPGGGLSVEAQMSQASLYEPQQQSTNYYENNQGYSEQGSYNGGQNYEQATKNTPFQAMLSGDVSPAEAMHYTDNDLESNLESIYMDFCPKAGEQGMMDSAGFVKFWRDMKVLGKGFTTTDCDLIFQKSKSAGNYAKRISYEEFRQISVPLVADRRGVTEGQILKKCSTMQGKILTGTVATYNKFHDDRSTYTGVYKQGGPTNNDNVITQEMLANRDIKGTVRGTPDRPDNYFTHSQTSVGALATTPREGKDIIHETPMYQRQGSSGLGGLPQPAPNARTPPARSSSTLNSIQSQQKYGSNGGSNGDYVSPLSSPPPGQGQQQQPAPDSGRADQANYGKQSSGSGFSLNRGSPMPPQAPDSQMMKKRMSGITGATVAGEANRAGGVYDRLSSTKTFTGVYAKRFDTADPMGGRINGDTVNSRHHGYKGNTNTGTDQRVDDISQILRR